MICVDVRNMLGVYVVGAIDPADRSVVDRHVAYCRACRDELAGLAGLPALLGRVTEAQIAEIGQPPEEPFESALAEVVAQRRTARQRRWWSRGRLSLAIAAPAAAAAIVGAVMLQPVPPGPPKPSPTPPRTLVVPQTVLRGRDPATGITATVGLTGRKWGTSLTAQLTGVPVGTSCKLVAISSTGKRDAAASWRVVSPGAASFTGSTMLAPNEISRIEISAVDSKRPFVSMPVR